jgi:hypothetical protein
MTWAHLPGGSLQTTLTGAVMILISSGLRRAALGLLASGLIHAGSASAAFLSFDTLADGTPFAGLFGFFPAVEYAARAGVTIIDSDNAPGVTIVKQNNPANAGTAIAGYYVNVDPFGAGPTFLRLDFAPGVTDVAFDFATPTGALGVTALDATGSFIGARSFLGDTDFLNQAGEPFESGHAMISGLGPIAALIVTPGATQALIFDNLNTQPIPEPGTLSLLMVGLAVAGTLGLRRRNHRGSSS